MSGHSNKAAILLGHVRHRRRSWRGRPLLRAIALLTHLRLLLRLCGPLLTLRHRLFMLLLVLLVRGGKLRRRRDLRKRRQKIWAVKLDSLVELLSRRRLCPILLRGRRRHLWWASCGLNRIEHRCRLGRRLRLSRWQGLLLDDGTGGVRAVGGERRARLRHNRRLYGRARLARLRGQRRRLAVGRRLWLRSCGWRRLGRGDKVRRHSGSGFGEWSMCGRRGEGVYSGVVLRLGLRLLHLHRHGRLLACRRLVEITKVLLRHLLWYGRWGHRCWREEERRPNLQCRSSFQAGRPKRR